MRQGWGPLCASLPSHVCKAGSFQAQCLTPLYLSQLSPLLFKAKEGFGFQYREAQFSLFPGFLCVIKGGYLAATH